MKGNKIVKLGFGALCVMLIVILASCTDMMAGLLQDARSSFLENIMYRDMVEVPGGSFDQLRYEQTDTIVESYQHTLSDYMIGAYEVTYELWYVVRTWAEGNGYEFGNLGREGSQGTIGAEPDSNMYHPVTNISWRDAIVWLNAYSEMQGLDPVYCKDSGMTVPIKQSVAWSGDLFTEKGSQDNPYINLDSDGYRLPTEGEWQYAATDRGENGADFAAGNYQFWVRDLSASDYDYALFNYIETKKVGQLTSPNELEIFDMSGNVRELCVDYFEPYPFEAQDDYIGQGGIGMRVVRGGSWLDPDVQRYPIQSGFRQSFEQYLTEDTTGFRVARSMPR